MDKRRMLYLVWLIAFILVGGTSARADTVYTNFGPEYTYGVFGNYTALDPRGLYELAGRFSTGPDSFLFSGARLALFGCDPGFCGSLGGDFQLSLLDNNFNVLEVIAHTDPLGGYGTTVHISASSTTMLARN